MKNYAVWLDSENAHIFALKPSGIEKSHIKKNDSDHHRRHKNDLHGDSNSGLYYHDLADQLKSADQLLLMGPGLAKNHFKDYLETHHTQNLAKKIVGIENLEKLTENQTLEAAHKFFKHHDVFT